MGFGGISIWQLLIILVIIVLLFGTKRLRNIGTDLGSAIRGFRSSLKENDSENTTEADATFPEARKEVANSQTTAAPAAQATPVAPATTTATPAQPGANNNSGAEKH